MWVGTLGYLTQAAVGKGWEPSDCQGYMACSATQHPAVPVNIIGAALLKTSSA